MQPVGQLDDQHPDVAGHRHDHLADGLGLRRLAVRHLVELGDAVDQHRDLVAEVRRAAGVERVVGVLDRVVQQRRRERRRRHAELGEDRRDGQRVGDVRVAALALLAAVGLLGHVVGALDDREVGLGVGRADGPQQRLEHRVARSTAGRRAGQPGADPAGRRDGPVRTGRPRRSGGRSAGRRRRAVGTRGRAREVRHVTSSPSTWASARSPVYGAATPAGDPSSLRTTRGRVSRTQRLRPSAGCARPGPAAGRGRQERQLDQHGDRDDLAAARSTQLARRPRPCRRWPARRPRPAPARPATNASCVDLDRGAAVLQVVLGAPASRPGSLPALRTGTNPAPRATATGAARMKPRASMPTTTSTLPAAAAARCATTAREGRASASSGVMSLKTHPGARGSRARRGQSAPTQLGDRRRAARVTSRRLLLAASAGCAGPV